MIFLDAGLPIAGIASAFLLSGVAGQIIVIVLFLSSIFAWSLVITKYMELSQAERMSKSFLGAYRREAHPVSLFLKRQRYDASPLYSIYERICSSLGAALDGTGKDNTADLFMGSIDTTNRKIGELHMQAVRNSADKTMAEKVQALEKHMGFVAITTTTAPLLGLLGTVWGAMDAFENAISGGSAMLSAVAPGISGALLTTVIGLLVAIPSGVGYNMLTEKIQRLCVEMDNFSQDLLLSIDRHYLQLK